MFTLRPSPGNTCSFVYSTPLEGTAGSGTTFLDQTLHSLYIISKSYFGRWT